MEVQVDIGKRMKENYEGAYKVYLPKRLPLVIRVDGRAFTKLTKYLEKPWCTKFCDVMDLVALELCRQIEGAQASYNQSDECSVLVHNYKTLQTQAWFDNDLQKLVSVSASIASSVFTLHSYKVFGEYKLISFDSRAFVLPESEVCNYFIWRQLDATRNAVSMLARSKFSHKKCEGKSSNQLQEMLFQEHNINFNNLEPYYKRGRCVVRKVDLITNRSSWVVDREIPIFSQERSYIEDLLKVEY